MHMVVIGAGYVGLVSGTCLAEMGHQVTCVDINPERVAWLRQGIVPIYEPGLEEMLKRNIKSKRLAFTEDYAASIPQAELCFIAVDTPPTVHGAADTSQVEAAAKTLARYLRPGCIVATKSTVPVGTTLKLAAIIRAVLAERQAPIDFDMVSNPEFLKEGNAVQDFMKPNRIIIGVENSRAAEIMRSVYAPFMLNHDRLLVMDILSAELSKYAANAMLATRISFMNEMAGLCERMGGDINCIRKAIGADERIGHQFLYPGVGFGGSCLPKDIAAILAQARGCGMELPLLQAVQQTNQRQKQVMNAKLEAYFATRGGLAGKTIGILGLSFKPDTDDLREASSLVLIDYLLGRGARLNLFDPIALPKAKALIGQRAGIHWCQDELEAAAQAHALVLMTEWKQFRFLDFPAILARMRGHAFFDGRNQYPVEEMAERGFDYVSIGRPAAYASCNCTETAVREFPRSSAAPHP